MTLGGAQISPNLRLTVLIQMVLIKKRATQHSVLYTGVGLYDGGGAHRTDLPQNKTKQSESIKNKHPFPRIAIAHVDVLLLMCYHCYCSLV